MQSKTVLMEGEGMLPILQTGDGRYIVDADRGQFRQFDKPWVVYRFDSCLGRQLLTSMEAAVQMD